MANSLEGSGSASNISCSPFDSNQYVIVAIVSLVSAVVSILACLFVIVLIVLFKRYIFYIWRLVLYLTIAALVRSFAISIHRIDFVNNQQHTDYCKFAGFFSLYTSWSELLAVMCITCNIFINVILNKRTEKLEFVYILVIIFLPALICGLPFIEDAYGAAGPWCWLRTTNDDCSTFRFGKFLIFGVWYGPLYLILIILVATYFGILCKSLRGRHKWFGKYDAQLEQFKAQLTKDVKPLVCYPMIYIIINIIPFITHVHRVTRPDSPVFELWVVTALIFPLPGGMIALAFTLTPETLKGLRWKQLRAAGRSWCSRNEVKELSMQTEGREIEGPPVVYHTYETTQDL